MLIKGIGISVSRQGIIEKIWYDSFGVDTVVSGETPFIKLVDGGSRQKAMDLFHEIESGSKDYGSQLDLRIGEKVINLDFGGFSHNGLLLLFGIEPGDESTQFLNYLQQINNEHINTIRSLKKENAEFTLKNQSGEKDDEILIDEISRLNNEMTNVQRELTKKNLELEQVNKLKNTFLGMAAHDLRNPLNIIISYADFIIDEASEKLEPEHLDFLNRIVRSSDYMIGLIENLLDYTKIEEGKMDLAKSDFDIVALSRQSIEANNVLASNKEVKITFTSNVKNLIIHFDYQKMEQVFNNLLSNAVKFSYPGSIVELQLEKHKQSLYLYFRDHGQGIKSCDLEQLYVPFGKISKKGTKGEKGTGLGLSIVKKIVEAHDGSVEVESEEGEGTMFTLKFPLVDNDAKVT